MTLPATHLGALQRVSRADASAAFASLLSGLDHYRRRGVSGGTDPQAVPAALESAGRAWMTIAATFRHDDVLRGALLRRVRGLVAPASGA